MYCESTWKFECTLCGNIVQPKLSLQCFIIQDQAEEKEETTKWICTLAGTEPTRVSFYHLGCVPNSRISCK